jgi:hypothetical protein
LGIAESAGGTEVLRLTSSPVAGIVIGEVAGTVTVTITGAETETVAAALTTGGVWDLLLTAPDATTVRLLEGEVVISRAVTT